MLYSLMCKGGMNMGNALNTLSSATKEDTKLYNCIKELYEQGVPFDELKALMSKGMGKSGLKNNQLYNLGGNWPTYRKPKN